MPLHPRRQTVLPNADVSDIILLMKRPKALVLIAIYGIQGSGKSSLGEALCKELSYTAHIGVDRIKRFISQFREISSHYLVSKKVINAMTAAYLASGINVIVEQEMNRGELAALSEIADDNGDKFLVYRLDIERALAWERIKKRSEVQKKPSTSQRTLDNAYRTHNAINFRNTAVYATGSTTTQDLAQSILPHLQH